MKCCILDFQMEIMRIKRKQEETKRALAIFCPKCTRRHHRTEFPLKVIEVLLVCEENNATDKCHYFLDLKFVYQGVEGGAR